MNPNPQPPQHPPQIEAENEDEVTAEDAAELLEFQATIDELRGGGKLTLELEVELAGMQALVDELKAKAAAQQAHKEIKKIPTTNDALEGLLGAAWGNTTYQQLAALEAEKRGEIKTLALRRMGELAKERKANKGKSQPSEILLPVVRANCERILADIRRIEEGKKPKKKIQPAAPTPSSAPKPPVTPPQPQPQPSAPAKAPDQVNPVPEVAPETAPLSPDSDPLLAEQERKVRERIADATTQEEFDAILLELYDKEGIDELPEREVEEDKSVRSLRLIVHFHRAFPDGDVDGFVPDVWGLKEAWLRVKGKHSEKGVAPKKKNGEAGPIVTTKSTEREQKMIESLMTLGRECLSFPLSLERFLERWKELGGDSREIIGLDQKSNDDPVMFLVKNEGNEFFCIPNTTDLNTLLKSELFESKELPEGGPGARAVKFLNFARVKQEGGKWVPIEKGALEAKL